MRTLIAAISFVLIPMGAHAQTPGPIECQDVAAVPASARSDAPVMAARASLAMCGAEVRMNAIPLADDDWSMAALEAAIAPAKATLDDLAASGDPAWQVIAAHARADLYLGAVARMRAAIPPMRAGLTGEALIEEQGRFAQDHLLLEQRLAPWVEQARGELQRAVDVAQAHRDLVYANPVVAAAFQHSENDLAALSAQ